MLFNSKDGLLIDEKGNLVSGKVMFDENGEFSTFRSFFCSFSKKYFSEKEDVSLLHLLTGESSSKGDFIKNVIEFIYSLKECHQIRSEERIIKRGTTQTTIRLFMSD